MKVVIKNKEYIVPLRKKMRVSEVFRHLTLNPINFIVIDTQASQLLTPDEWVDENTRLEFRSVVSGG